VPAGGQRSGLCLTVANDRQCNRLRVIVNSTKTVKMSASHIMTSLYASTRVSELSRGESFNHTSVIQVSPRLAVDCAFGGTSVGLRIDKYVESSFNLHPRLFSLRYAHLDSSGLHTGTLLAGVDLRVRDGVAKLTTLVN
jgi:hypothetical protein